MAALLAAVVLTAGCSSGKGSKPPAAPSTTTTLPVSSIPSNGAIPISVPNIAADRKEVTMPTCGQSPGGWSAGGTADNPTSNETQYQITVFFIDSGDTVEGYGVTTVDVPAGRTQYWSVSSQFAAQPGTRCVLRGVG